MVIRGVITKGFGEGSFYVSRYGQLFEQKLGFLPFSGTLNIRVKERPKLKNSVTVSPGGAFKPVQCYMAKIRPTSRSKAPAVQAKSETSPCMRCAIVVPEATRHPKDVLEIVAPVSVKEHYGLKDGDEIEVEIE